MAHRKAGGTARNLRDSNPQYLGVKLSHGSTAKPGAIIIRQRGTYFTAGKNVGLGKDHTIFALTSGIVNFKTKRKPNYDSRQRLVKVVSVS